MDITGILSIATVFHFSICVYGEAGPNIVYMKTLQSSGPLSCSGGFTELGYYNGSVSQTDSGSSCLKWTDFPDYMLKYPNRGLGDHNYCRNPDRESNPWCFFRQKSGAIGWTYCDCHQGAVRLVGGSSNKSGRLEVYMNGQWGAVCGTHLTDRDASVICGQLRLGEIGTALRHSYFGPGSGLFHFERLGCHGNENSVLECRSRKYVSGDCNHGNEAGVVCDVPKGSGAPLRLVGGLEDFEGRVEVYQNGRWGTICDDEWDDIDAEVVCRQLGLGGVPKAWTWAHFGQGTGPIFLDGVHCTGNELSLEECTHAPWGRHNCDHMEDAGVSCNPYTDGVLRLVGADSPWEGRLEVYHAGQWGTVCDDSWTGLHAQVVCRQLGYRGRAELAPDGMYGQGTGLILLDEVKCEGGESSLLDCAHGEWGKHDCSHSEDVGIRCEREQENNEIPEVPPVTGPLVRLVNGESRKEGRVEVFINGEWGSVCDDGWDDINAGIVCRQLGFIGASKARSMAYFGEGQGPIHLDNVKCVGTEASLGECSALDLGAHDCRHSEDAGVICDYITEPIKDKQECGLRPNTQRRQRRIIGGDKSLRFGTDPSRYVVRLGDYHTEERDDFERTLSPERIIIHKRYHSQGWEYDIALMKLKGTDGNCVAFNPHTNAVCLPAQSNKRGKRPIACVITGWGITDSEYSRTLLQAWVPILPSWKCKKCYGSRFTSRMLCAGSLSNHRRVDSCQGDSGGPLVCQGEGGHWMLTGIISWGHGCGNPTYPGVYTRVSRFLKWIEKVTDSSAKV
ncbi:neurotrypsin-like isoform X2 [Myxocyprinus asiaticus]|uniref:neurotrypsin-like isoform X2 n=1 Tax=Myxocyprinus asiaticus TaxID=70543 RepID=UPI0022235CEF|nr:neurotrypsin-like isoform X2 [Myxocyprinus asiaticus]